MKNPVQNKPVNYNAYSTFLRKKFGGKRVYKISIDAGFTCPNRDGMKGYGGCSYCNVDSFTPPNVRSLPSIPEQIKKGMLTVKKLFKAEKFILYFQPNTNTYAPVHVLKKYFDEALAVCPEGTVGLSVRTRADCLDNEKMELLEDYAKSTYVNLEIGLESMHDKTLKKINRGHTHSDFVETMQMIESRQKNKSNNRIDICIHAVFGFPWESREKQLQYAEVFNQFDIQFVKLHQLHIVKGSAMAVEFKREPFSLYTLESYTDFLCALIPRLRPNLVIQRLFATSYRDFLIAPTWQENKSLVKRYIENEFHRRGIVQGSRV